jgi:DeoR/GlpR family transcriptional regulator of sugar metabolism
VLLKEERQRLMGEAVRKNGMATVAELSEVFGVSEITVRRDLAELSDRGVVERAHGGAVAHLSQTKEPPIVQRMKVLRHCKEAIARAAAELVGDGESIFVGSGTTTAYLARGLSSRQGLTVVTNALTVARELATADGVTTVVTGGMMRDSELSLVGHITEISLREVRVDKVFLGIPAVSLEHGLTNDYLPEVMTDRAIIEMAEQLIVLADHSKFGKTGSAYVAPIERVGVLVTDSETDLSHLAEFERHGIQVIRAGVRPCKQRSQTEVL